MLAAAAVLFQRDGAAPPRVQPKDHAGAADLKRPARQREQSLHVGEADGGDVGGPDETGAGDERAEAALVVPADH